MPVSLLRLPSTRLCGFAAKRLLLESSNLLEMKRVSSRVSYSKSSVKNISTRTSNGTDKMFELALDNKNELANHTDEVDAIRSNDEIDGILNDSSVLSTMTVTELRKLTRTVGISSKGNKKDLVSALTSYTQKSKDAGASLSLDSEMQVTNGTAESELPKSMRLKRKSKDLVIKKDSQIQESVSEVTKGKRKRSTRKQNVTDTTVVHHSKDILGEDTSVVSEHLEKTEEKNHIVLEAKQSEPWTMLAHKKPLPSWMPYDPKNMRPPHLSRETKFVKLMSWNVNGLRALLKAEVNSILQLAENEDFDVLCLQETKLKDKDVEVIKNCLSDHYQSSFWNCSVSKLGYSGSAIISRIKPISVKYGLGISDHDSEGRLVTVEFDSFFLISAYVPNSGDGLRRLDYRVKEWDPSLSKYLKNLEQSKPVILTGDLNCAHEEIDIYDPTGNRRSAGFTLEERESFKLNFLSKGFVDTFRKQHPDVVAYTYWGYRHGGRKTNKGWRLDYFLASDTIADKVHDSYIVPNILGSDHCPIGLVLKL